MLPPQPAFATFVGHSANRGGRRRRWQQAQAEATDYAGERMEGVLHYGGKVGGGAVSATRLPPPPAAAALPARRSEAAHLPPPLARTHSSTAEQQQQLSLLARTREELRPCGHSGIFHHGGGEMSVVADNQHLVRAAQKVDRINGGNL
ncbi:Hypothetical predicted protein [Cloeon dipterum]|uniref:Uncharacterized protein n=1 Tax=Cloeon dipterum TaxID=197152 RepID=A0A8S1DCF8_9INSE|nr:Hypothetical predicted protein [Cloeon dipterum]